MTEEYAADEQTDEEHAREDDLATAGPVRTGDAEIDALLDRVEGLDAVSVEEHVAVFEQAHEQLRRALDAQPTTS